MQIIIALVMGRFIVGHEKRLITTDGFPLAYEVMDGKVYERAVANGVRPRQSLKVRWRPAPSFDHPLQTAFVLARA